MAHYPTPGPIASLTRGMRRTLVVNHIIKTTTIKG